MNKLFPRFLLIILLYTLTCCTASVKRKMASTTFAHVNPNEIISALTDFHAEPGLNHVIKDFRINENDILYLRDIVDTIYGVKLQTNHESLIGTIDKIRLTKDRIYVLDRYKTKTLKCFDRQGSYLMTIGKHGSGPGEYIEPTDFYLGEDEIVINDQFQSKILVFNIDGNLLEEKQIPYFFLQFHKFTPNQYLMCGLDSDNYHLEEILNYSIWTSDSNFVVKHRGVYREKDRYINYLPKNSLNVFNDILYFKDPRNDTIHSIYPNGEMRYDYIVDFGKKTVPQQLREIKYDKENKKEFRSKNYAFGSEYAVTRNYFYYRFSVETKNYHLIHSIKHNKTYCASIIINDINFIFPFFNILTTEDNMLVGYTNSMSLYEKFHSAPEDAWEKMKGRNNTILSNEGRDVVNFCKDLKIDDNPVITFFKLKD